MIPHLAPVTVLSLFPFPERDESDAFCRTRDAPICLIWILVPVGNKRAKRCLMVSTLNGDEMFC